MGLGGRGARLAYVAASGTAMAVAGAMAAAMVLRATRKLLVVGRE